jgi:hypothetical protein
MRIAQRGLARQAPAGIAVGIQVQFQLVFDIGIAGQHRHVLRQVSLAERMGKHLGRRAPDQRRLVPLAATLDQVWLTTT